jgi:hypothetical protein
VILHEIVSAIGHAMTPMKGMVQVLASTDNRGALQNHDCLFWQWP